MGLTISVPSLEVASNPHGELCRCHKCVARAMGSWIDSLGPQTSTQHWQLFGTVTFRTPYFPWRKGFPMGGSYRPSPHFVHRNYRDLIAHLERRLCSPVDYVVADQIGAINGRLHQHFILASPGLETYPRREIWEFLYARAGFNRILPFERGAAFYIGRYIGRAIPACEWDVPISRNPTIPTIPRPVGRTEIVRSVEMEKQSFKNTKKGWHR